MNSQEYKAEVLRTYAGLDDAEEKLTLAALGLTGESGEVADHMKKAIFQGHALDLDHLKEELGDILWYVVLACDAIDCSLEDVVRMNVEKLRKRYPKGFDAGRSIHRDLYEQSSSH